jgi:hypothetical protein
MSTAATNPTVVRDVVLSSETAPNLMFHLDYIGLWDNYPEFPEPGQPLGLLDAEILLNEVRKFVGIDRPDFWSEKGAGLANSLEMLAEAARLLAKVECERSWGLLEQDIGYLEAASRRAE